MNLFYGRQFYFIYNNIKNHNEILNMDIFKSVLNFDELELIRNDFLFQSKDKKNYDLIIKELELYINNLFSINNKTYEDIYKKNIIKNEFSQYIGIFFYLSENQDIDSLFIYQKFTNNLPLNICFLYCTPDTTSDELIVFLYRSIYCNNNA